MALNDLRVDLAVGETQELLLVGSPAERILTCLDGHRPAGRRIVPQRLAVPADEAGHGKRTGFRPLHGLSGGWRAAEREDERRRDSLIILSRLGVRSRRRGRAGDSEQRHHADVLHDHGANDTRATRDGQPVPAGLRVLSGPFPSVLG